MCRPESDLEKRRVFIEKMIDPVARRQSAQLSLPLESGFAAALTEHCFLFKNLAAEFAQRLAGRCRCFSHVAMRL
jgi:hypothetical protein